MQLTQVIFLYAAWHASMFAWLRSPQAPTRSPLLGCLIHSLKRGGASTAACITPLPCNTYTSKGPTTICKTSNTALHPPQLSANLMRVVHRSREESAASVTMCREHAAPGETCHVWENHLAHHFCLSSPLRYFHALSENAAHIRLPYPQDVQLGVATTNVICTMP